MQTRLTCQGVPVHFAKTTGMRPDFAVGMTFCKSRLQAGNLGTNLGTHGDWDELHHSAKNALICNAKAA
jgi:hypothetical protein